MVRHTSKLVTRHRGSGYTASGGIYTSNVVSAFVHNHFAGFFEEIVLKRSRSQASQRRAQRNSSIDRANTLKPTQSQIDSVIVLLTALNLAAGRRATNR